MFSRAMQERGGAPLDQDPLPLRIASAAVVLGLLATGFVVVSRDAAARGGPSGGPVAGPPATTGPGQPRSAGLRLLSQAAAACQNVAYQGVQVIASLSPAGRSVSVVEVWHERGRQALIQATAPVTPPSLRRGAARLLPETGSATSDEDQDSAPNLGMTRQMVALLGANYQVAMAGGGVVDGRPVQVVAVRRASGELAARFWVDSATKLPLRRQIFDTSARVISEDAFIDLKLGTRAAAGAPAAGARPRSSPLSVRQLARLRAQGWPLPGPLPGRLTEFAASSAVTASGPVVELAYSDGLSVVSLFVQRGQLPADLSGWSEVALHGHRVYAADPDERSVAWSAGGFVYTVIADSAAQTVDQVVAALPHNATPGLIARLIRGLRRLSAWADPFH